MGLLQVPRIDLGLDLLAVGAEHVPDVAETLAVGVAGRLVATERVEQVAVVGDLHRAVGLRLLCRLRGVEPGADGRGGRRHRRPCLLEAGRHLARGVGAIGLVQIHGHPLRVDEDRLAHLGVGRR